MLTGSKQATGNGMAPHATAAALLDRMGGGAALCDASDLTLRHLNPAGRRILFGDDPRGAEGGWPSRPLPDMLRAAGWAALPAGNGAGRSAGPDGAALAALLRAGGRFTLRRGPAAPPVLAEATPLPEDGLILLELTEPPARLSRPRDPAPPGDTARLAPRHGEDGDIPALYRLALDRMADGLLLWNRDHCVLVANRAMGRLYALPPGLARIGADCREVLRHMVRQAAAEDEQALQARIASAMLPTGEEPELCRAPTGAWVEVTRIALPAGGMLTTHRDVTRLKRREEELQAARAIQHRVLETMTDGVVLWDADFRVVFANSAAERLGEFPAAFATPGTEVMEVMRFQDRRGDFGPPPADAAELEARVRARAALLRRPEGARYVRRTPGGQWVEVKTVALPDGGAMLAYRNVTALKRREEELAAARDEAEAARRDLATTIEHIDQGLLMFAPDRRVRVLNRRAAELLRLPPALARPGAHQRDIIAWQLDQGEYAATPDIEARARRVRDGEPLVEGRSERRRPDGSILEVHARNLPDGGQVRTFTDITERRHAEAALAAARDQAEAAQRALVVTLDSMGQGLMMYGADRRLAVLNRRAAELLQLPPGLARPGVPMKAILEHQLAQGEFAASPAAAELARRARAGIEGGQRLEAASATFERVRPDGTVLEVRFGRAPGDGVVLTYTDITDRKRAEAELGEALAAAEAARAEAEAADRAKSTFLATMSHEIRTPMNGVLGMMEVLERSGLAPDQARCLAVMRDSAGALLRIIDDVLDFSRIESGRLELEVLPFSVRQVVDSVLEAFAPEARRKALDLRCSTHADGPDLVLGDSVRVRQILLNLVGNAIKFTERGLVQVRVSTVAAEGVPAIALVTLSVEDSGLGLAPEAMARLFQPFAQADSSTTRRFGGSGLGLSIVRRLARLMGGDVVAESEGPGRGSRFIVTLRLPVAQPDLRAGAPRPTAPAVPLPVADGTAPHLLVADDNPVNQEVLVRQLELLGCRATVAEDGAAAFATWRAGGHRAVLVDLHMPVMDGIGLARAIRQEEAATGRARTPLIAVTASALKGEAERCLAAGMDGFVSKPVAIDSLRDALTRVLAMDAAAGRAPETGGEGDGAADPVLFDSSVLEAMFGNQPDRLARLIDRFVRVVAQERVAIAGAVQGGDLAAAARAAHKLKGTGDTAGARPLAAAAARLEKVALCKDAAATRDAAAALDVVAARTLAALPGADGSTHSALRSEPTPPDGPG